MNYERESTDGLVYYKDPMEADLNERKLYAGFEKHDLFLGIQRSLLSKNLEEEPSKDEDEAEHLEMSKLSAIVSFALLRRSHALNGGAARRISGTGVPP